MSRHGGPAGYPAPRDRDVRGPARFLWWLVVGQRRRVALAAFLGTAWMLGLILPPYVLSLAIDQGLATRRYSALLGWVLVLLALGGLNAYIAIARHRTLSKVRMDAAFRTLSAVVEHCATGGGVLAEQVTAGELATIGIGDVWVISSSLTVVGPGVGAVIAYLAVAGLLLAISPLLAVVVLLGAPLVAVLVGPPLGRLGRAGAVYRGRQAQLTTRLVDLVDGLRVLNGIGGKELFAQRYLAQSRRLRDEGYRVGAVASWIPTLGAGLPLLFLGVVTWLAARMAAEHEISVGDLVAVYGYVAVLVVPITELIENGSGIARAMVAAGRVTALLRLGDGSSAGEVPTGDGPDGPADLHDPDSGVLVGSGRFTALAGAHPADAVAVVDRLGGLRPSAATWGAIRLDTVAPRRVRERILVADNEAAIFAGTLHHVVAGRYDRDEPAVIEALHAAVAEDVAAGLPLGLGSPIEPGGRNLSGGQRQRIRLARALLADPEVLLANEPTSAVDAHTEALIADRLAAARAGRTTLVTTTSPLLLDRADVVHHLVDGRVVATGTHRELMERQPRYRALVARGLDEDAPASAGGAR